MKKETTFVLAGIVAVMLGFIVFYEQGTLSSGELESRRGQVLDRFVRARVHHIRVERGEEVVVDLVRDEEAEETLDTFDVGTWRLAAPVTGAADPDAIDSLLLACEALSARRTIEHPSAEDRARFGLDAPRVVLTLEVADETQVVRVGAHDDGLDADYVEVVGLDRVHLVGQDFFEALDQSTDQFRSKELFDELAARDVTAMTLRYAHEGAEATEARVALVDHRWVASVPFRGWARHGVVLGIVDGLLDAHVARYVHEGGEALVGSSTVTLTMTTKERDAEGRDTGRLRERTVVVGARCEAQATDEGVELLSVRVGDGAVVCVARQALETLLGSESTLRETRLVAANDDQVERLVFGLDATGSTDAVLEVRRDEDRWVLREGDTSRAADAQAVSEFLAALHTAEAESFEDVSEASLAARGLDAPRMRLRVHRSDDESIVEFIDVGAVDTVGVWVRRGEEPVLARYVGDVDELLVPNGLRFRARDVITREADDVVGLSITRDGVEERPATENGAWRIEAPHALAADRIATRDAVRALTSLRAVRWVGDEVDASMGLATPRLRVHLTMREPATPDDGDDAPDAGAQLPTSIDLLVGSPTDGGAFAKLESEAAVFVLSGEILDALSHPLLDREIVALDTSNATRITLTVRGTSVVIDRREGEWRSADAVAAPDATDAFLERLRSLRARGVLAYGDRPSFANAEIVVVVESPSGTRRLEVGGTTGEGDAAFAPARVSDVSAELQLSPEIVGAIASYRP